jgi:hypothetical protein
MRERGRQVVPWFQTCVAISLFVAITSTMLSKVILGDSWKLSESIFLIVFMGTGLICFFLIKQYFF